jgi:glutamate formiminotransferase/formiminotetrahydrofolate cyclodeaminase
LDQANLHATEVPLQTMRDALAVLKQAHLAAAAGNPNSVSDAGVAALVAYAGLEGAWLNVKINLGGLADEARAQELKSEGETLLNEGKSMRDAVLAEVDRKIG